MSKRVINRVCVVLFLGIALTALWTFCKLFFAGSAYYTERDWIEYKFYTPELLKEIPRISNKYKFDFVNVTGTDAHVFTVHFYGVTDSSEIRNYLRNKGYEPLTSCDVEAECWKKRHDHENDVISIAKFQSPKEVFVQIYRKFGTPYDEFP